MREVQYIQAIREAIAEEMERDEKVFVLGEGVQTSTLKVTEGLVDKFGRKRIIDTPICETAIAGMAVGASHMGYRPIADMGLADFMYVAADEILLKAAGWRLTNGGTQKIPVVFLAAIGGWNNAGNEHSRSPYSLVMREPGLKLVVPSNPYDAKGLMKTAIRDNNPVVYFYHKHLFGQKSLLPEEEYTVPFGKAEVKREGSDVTVVGVALMVQWALNAAEKLKDRISVEVIDPRTLEPLDLETILRSVKKTGRLVIVEEGNARCGFAAELTTQVMEHGFDLLDAPIKRVCTKNYPIPGYFMEKHVFPKFEEVVAAIEAVVK
jgi:acetoin:2,6-dichlorophenolindophenol oxidoreductase subunit beta